MKINCIFPCGKWDAWSLSVSIPVHTASNKIHLPLSPSFFQFSLLVGQSLDQRPYPGPTAPLTLCILEIPKERQAWPLGFPPCTAPHKPGPCSSGQTCAWAISGVLTVANREGQPRAKEEPGAPFCRPLSGWVHLSSLVLLPWESRVCLASTFASPHSFHQISLCLAEMMESTNTPTHIYFCNIHTHSACSVPGTNCLRNSDSLTPHYKTMQYEL